MPATTTDEKTALVIEVAVPDNVLHGANRDQLREALAAAADDAIERFLSNFQEGAVEGPHGQQGMPMNVPREQTGNELHHEALEVFRGWCAERGWPCDRYKSDIGRRDWQMVNGTVGHLAMVVASEKHNLEKKGTFSVEASKFLEFRHEAAKLNMQATVVFYDKWADETAPLWAASAEEAWGVAQQFKEKNPKLVRPEWLLIPRGTGRYVGLVL